MITGGAPGTGHSSVGTYAQDRLSVAAAFLSWLHKTETQRFPGSHTTVCPHKSSPMTNAGTCCGRGLHDETMQLRIREARALVLRYGQTTTRIVELTRATT
jgi:hypothetical protein